MQYGSIHCNSCQRRSRDSTCRDTLYLDSACNIACRIDNRKQRTGSGTGKYQPDTDQYNQCSSNGNLYSYPNIRSMCGSYVYNNGDSQSECNDSKQDSDNMQCGSIQCNSCQRRSRDSTCRDTLYLDSACNIACRIDNRKQCTGSRTGKYQPDTDQYYQCSGYGNLYSYCLL